MKRIKEIRKRQQILPIKQSAMIIAFTGIFLFGCDQTEEIPVPINAEPLCIITSPHEGDEIDNYEDVIIEVDAADNDGFITEVRFYVNGEAAGSSNSFPYRYVMENPSIGSYEFKATALDAEGGSTSDQINVIITNIQDRLDRGQPPIEIFQNNRDYLDSLYGKMYQGGLIFYLDTINGSGLVVAPEDQSTGVAWANSSISTGADEYSIGTGKANTEAIVKALGDGNYAAKLCDGLDLNGYSDWFLPNDQELYTLAVRVRNELPVNIYYWSSREYTASNALSCSNLGSAFATSNTPKNNVRRVRAVRAF